MARRRLNTLADGQAPRITPAVKSKSAVKCLNTLADGQAPRILYGRYLGNGVEIVSIPSLMGRLLGWDGRKNRLQIFWVSIPSLMGRLLGSGPGCALLGGVGVSIPSLMGRLLGLTLGPTSISLFLSLNTLADGQAPRIRASRGYSASAVGVSIPSLMGRLLGYSKIIRKLFRGRSQYPR